MTNMVGWTLVLTRGSNHYPSKRCLDAWCNIDDEESVNRIRCIQGHSLMAWLMWSIWSDKVIARCWKAIWSTWSDKLQYWQLATAIWFQYRFKLYQWNLSIVIIIIDSTINILYLKFRKSFGCSKILFVLCVLILWAPQSSLWDRMTGNGSSNI